MHKNDVGKTFDELAYRDDADRGPRTPVTEELCCPYCQRASRQRAHGYPVWVRVEPEKGSVASVSQRRIHMICGECGKEYLLVLAWKGRRPQARTPSDDQAKTKST